MVSFPGGERGHQVREMIRQQRRASRRKVLDPAILRTLRNFPDGLALQQIVGLVVRSLNVPIPGHVVAERLAALIGAGQVTCRGDAYRLA